MSTPELIEATKKKMREGALSIVKEIGFDGRLITTAKLDQWQIIPPSRSYVFSEEQFIAALQLAFSRGFEQCCMER